MPQKKRPTRLQRAVDYVLQGINRGDFMRGEFLPGIRSLSKGAGVGIQTMWKAVGLLRAQGVLDGHPRHRFKVRRGKEETNPFVGVTYRFSYMEKWRKIREYIRRDILNGVFAPNTVLPSAKELSERYGASRTTLKRALDSLEDDTLVMRYRKTYRVVPLVRSPNPHLTIAVIGKADEMYSEYWHQEMYRYLDFQCNQTNIGWRVVGFEKRDDGTVSYVDQPFRKTVRLLDTADTAGYILHITGPLAFDEETVSRVVSLRKPIAVLDETGGWDIPSFLKASPFVHIFTMTTSRRAGCKVGRYLLERGHRDVGFIAPYHRACWSMRRLEGVVDVFSDAGLIPLLRIRTFNQFSSRHDFLPLGRWRSGVEELERFYQRWRSSLPADFVFHTDAAMDRLGNIACAEGEIAYQLRAAFDDLVADSHITAWIAVNDSTARMAWDYLHRHSISVPERISLVSFDDTPLAVEYGLTSYNFNYSAVVNAMLGYVVRFKASATHHNRGGGGHTEIEGYIAERRSCARLALSR